jgi:hypothetical protein
MARSTPFKYALLILCLGVQNLLAQQADVIPPLPTSYASPPPDPETLPPPPPLDWAPLGPKDEGGDVGVGISISVPPPQGETPIAPPPSAVEVPVVDGVDPAQVEIAKPDVEIWRAESESPQIPVHFSNWLDKAYVTGTEPVWLRAQFNPLAAGKKVTVRAGRGIAVSGTATALTIPSSGEIVVQAQLTQGVDRSHINFYCNGTKTVLPVVRASLTKVEEKEAETGAGQ